MLEWQGGGDDPWDAEVALRNGLADMTSPNFSNLVMKGLSRGTSADLSGRVGLDSMFLARAPDGLEGQKLYEQLILGNMGATVGMGANIAKGIQELGQGNYARALEEMLPTFAKNPFKAYRYATEGVQDKTGVDILDGHPVSGAGIFSQTIGFSPSQVRTAYEGKSAIYQQQQALQKRKSKLTANWVRAKRNDDQEGMDSAWKDIQEFNEVNPKLRINRINLMQSYHQNAKRIRDAENGVYLSKKYRDIGDYGRFAETD
ncbi:PLxRFG domain-containing protein [Acinetobacter sp. CFCC 11171]|uniref:PLxRFG domain-containing protein n=1 Tax=Acinetobacter sp. CFCC 11171 TaxID=1775558 RepID=UPI0013A6DC80|nr:PLxRFG domain-containing protein [Acinetobacter sp. CFCC 11171]